MEENTQSTCQVCNEGNLIPDEEETLLINDYGKSWMCRKWHYCDTCGTQVSTFEDASFNAVERAEAERRIIERAMSQDV